MTVSTTASVAVFLGNGAADTFDYPFKVFEVDHLVVERRDATTKVVDHTYTLGEFTVDGLGEDAGSVTLLDGALSADYELVVRREVPPLQPMNIVNQSGFFPEVVERQFDETTMVVQELSNKVDRAMLAPAGDSGGELPADRVGKFITFDVNGDPVMTDEPGADGALRADLGADGGPLIRTVFPGFPAVVTSLGDLLPTVAASTFFGITSNGSTDDTDAWNAACEAMEHSTNPNGRVIFNEPGATSLISGEVVVRPGVTIDLRGGAFDAQLTGGTDAALHMMSKSSLCGGTISVTSTTPSGTQGAVHAPIFLGVLQGDAGPVDDLSEYAVVNGVYVKNMRLISTRPGAIGIVCYGDVYNCEFDGITIPDSALMSGAITFDWNIHGETVYEGNTVQGIWSDDDRQQLNKDAYDAWVADNDTGAYTAHPHNCVARNFSIGALTKAYTVSDTGTYAARISGGHGITFENFCVDLTTEATIIHHIGDLGYEYARPKDLVMAGRGNVYRDFSVRDAYRRLVIKADSYADNIADSETTDQRLANGTLSGSFYTPTYDPLYRVDTVYERIRGYTIEGNNATYGVLAQRLSGSSFIDCSMVGFTNNWRFDDAHDLDIVRMSSRFAREHGVLIEGDCTRLRFIDTKEAEASGQKTANTYDEVNVGASNGVEFHRGRYGEDTATPRQRSCIRVLNTGDGVTAVSMYGPIWFMSNGAAQPCVKLGALNNDQHLAWEINGGFRYGSNVTSRYDGLWTIPFRRRVQNGGLIMTDWQCAAADTLANYVLSNGDQFWYQNATSGNPPGRIAITDGTVDGTGSNLNTLTKEMAALA